MVRNPTLSLRLFTKVTELISPVLKSTFPVNDVEILWIYYQNHEPTLVCDEISTVWKIPFVQLPEKSDRVLERTEAEMMKNGSVVTCCVM